MKETEAERPFQDRSLESRKTPKEQHLVKWNLSGYKTEERQHRVASLFLFSRKLSFLKENVNTTSGGE
jgi:hypothetical protein